MVFKIISFANIKYWPKFQKLWIYSLSTLWSRNWAHFCSTYSGFWDTGRFSKLPYLGMKLVHWPRLQKLHTYSLNYLRGPNFAPFCSTAAHFQNMWQFFIFPLSTELNLIFFFQKIKFFEISKCSNFREDCHREFWAKVWLEKSKSVGRHQAHIITLCLTIKKQSYKFMKI